jgi:endonuclease G, mitochondrial
MSPRLTNRRGRGFPPALGVILVAAACGSASLSDQSIHASPTASEPTESTPGPAYRNHLEFGAPHRGGQADPLILVKETFVHSHDCGRGTPRWVAWHLNASHFGTARRSPVFLPDTSLPGGCRVVVSSDYSGSGYDRGHLVRSHERTRTPEDNRETFLLTNIAPQRTQLNGGPWHRFEQFVEWLARDGRELYLIAGSYGERGTLKGAGRITIPERFYKIVVALPRGADGWGSVPTDSIQVVAVDMPNDTTVARHGWRRYTTTVAAIERATGYDFLHVLPDSLERALEQRRFR